MNGAIGRSHQRQGQAIALALMGARTPLLIELCHLSTAAARGLIREVTGAPPRGGATPSCACTICKLSGTHLAASVFAAIYRATRTDTRRLTATDLILSYGMLLECGTSEQIECLSIDAAAVIAREVISGHCILTECKDCGEHFLTLSPSGIAARAATVPDVVNTSRKGARLQACPFCRHEVAWHCQCGARLTASGECSHACGSDDPRQRELRRATRRAPSADNPAPGG